MDVNCPLCSKKNIERIYNINVKELIWNYNKSLNDDISSEFNANGEIALFRCCYCDLRFFHPAISGSEKFYELLQKFDWYYMDEKYEYSFSEKYIKYQDRVLDVGCGKGAFGKKIKCIEYLGLELSKKAVKSANSQGICAINEKIEDFSSSCDKKYDVVCSFQVLEHISELKSFIESCIKCVKNGGFLIFAVPSYDSYLSKMENNILNMPPHHLTWWSDEVLKKIADIFELRLVEIKHEAVQDIHLNSYMTTICVNAIKDIFKMEHRLINNSLMSKITRKISAWISKLIVRGLNCSYLVGNGHTVIAVYQKT